MAKKYRLILIVSVIGLLVTLSTGTYAYIRQTVTEVTTNRIVALDCLDVTFEELSDSIVLDDAYPISDAEGLLTQPYRFKLTNNCPYSVSTEINIETMKLTGSTPELSNSYVKVALNSSTPALISSKANGTKYYGSTVSSSSKKLAGLPMAPGLEITYELRLWLDSSTGIAQMGKRYEGKIVVVANALSYTPVEPPSWNVSEGTLLYKIKNGAYTFASPMTTPGRAGSAESEGIIIPTQDDYGTSYVFRGNIENNYVVYANKCWRIVRVTGDDGDNGEGYNNAIKLILFNDNPNNVANPCDEAGGNLAFIRSSGTTFTYKFNTSSNYNAYIGYMYGTPNGGSYANEHANTQDSNVLTLLKQWYDNNSLGAGLADVIWCQDKDLETDTMYNAYNTNVVVTGLGYGNSKSYYKGMKRNVPNENAEPSLVCSDNSLGRYTAASSEGNAKLKGVNGTGEAEYKVGLLTLDEFDYLGGAFSSNNSSVYTYRNASSNNWWLLTPVGFVNNAQMLTVNINGSLVNSAVTNNFGIRPMIALNRNALATGDGTYYNPYIVWFHFN